MKFSSIIERHFRSIFRWTLVVGLASSALLSLFWVIQARDHSKKYIISQVRENAVAGINSQNMAALDGELRRIVNAWSSAEAFPVRVDVLLDNKLWAHGGQLHPFRWPAISDEFVEDLPSGHKLVIQMQTDIGNPLQRIGFALLGFISFFAVVFWTLYFRIGRAIKEVTTPLENRIQEIQAIAANLTDLAKLKLETSATSIHELDALDHSLQHLIDRILTLERDLSEVHFNDGQIEAAERLAHSLKGIVANFQLTLKSQSLLAHDREALSSSLRQLISVSENVLKSRKPSSFSDLSKTPEGISLINVGDVVKRLVESASQLNDKTFRKVGLNFLDMSDAAPTVKGPRSAFEGSINNILLNALDAVKEHGQINVSLSTYQNLVRLEFVDDGYGIATADLPQLTQKGFTTKKDGNGLGLFHARTAIEGMGGALRIVSSEGRGTTVSIELPRDFDVCAAKELTIFPGQTFIVVDDDKAVHTFFERLLYPYRDKIQIVYITSPVDFISWMSRSAEAAPGSRQYIFDCEFSNHKETGFDLIEKYGLNFESLVLSGVAHKTEIIERASKDKVPLMSKDRLSQLKIKWEGFEESFQEMIS